MGFSTKDYKTALDRQLGMLMLECDIETLTAINLFEESSALSEALSNDYFMEEEDVEKKKSIGTKITDTITKIFDSIIKLISNVIEMFGDVISSKQNASASDLLQSETGKIQLTHDLDKLEKVVNDDALKGRKMIQMISKGTGISDEKVADYCDNGLKAALAIAPVAIPLAIRFVSKRKFRDALGVQQKHIKDVKDDIENTKDAAMNMADNGKKNCIKIANHMKEMQQKFINAGKGLLHADKTEK